MSDKHSPLKSKSTDTTGTVGKSIETANGDITMEEIDASCQNVQPLMNSVTSLPGTSSGTEERMETSQSIVENLQVMMTEWESKLLSLASEYNQATEQNDTLRQKVIEAEMKKAQESIAYFKKSIWSLKKICQDTEATATKKEIARVGLTLTRKDLPKYQLASSVRLPFPNDEAFDSEEHFLRTFEKVVYSAGMDIEMVWDKYLPLCIHYDHDPWVEAELKRCHDWKSARKCFLNKFTTLHRTRESATMVFTMVMRDTETVTQYSTRFLRAVNDAGLNAADPMLAQRFLASLTQSVQVCTRIALYGKNESHDDLTIEEVAKVARDILGDSYRSYAAEAALVNAGLNLASGSGSSLGYGRKKQRMNNGNPLAVMSSRDPRMRDRIFCKKHGWNKTHDTQSCFSKKEKEKEANYGLSNKFFGQKNKPNPATNEKKDCLYCKKPWSPGHKCKEYFEQKRNATILSVKINNDEKPTNERAQNKKIESSPSDKDDENENDLENGIKDIMMDDIDYDFQLKELHEFELVNFNHDLEFDVLLGAEILPKMGIGLTGVAVNWNDGENVYSKNKQKDELFNSLNIDHDELYEPDNSPAGTYEERKAFMNIIQPSIDKNQKIPITSFCTIPESVVRLPTEKGATSYQRQYPIAHSLRPVLDKQIEEWLESGTIKRTTINTSFNSPLLLVPKTNKAGEIVSHRVCADVRGLNRLLPDVNYPVPIVMDILFEDMRDIVQTFVDDCIISSSSIKEHARDVKRVIDRLTSVNLILNPEKCSWFQHSVHMLGFVVNATGIKVDKNKLTNVESWPIPKTCKDIQRFMGLINYFRDFIPMISEVAAPIDSLRNDPHVDKNWTSLHTERFKALKSILQSKHILHYPDLNKKMYVATDASQYGAAAVLFQKDEKGRIKHIAFVSQSLSPSQRNWSTTKRELYAIILALKKFRIFLLGKHFEVQCDHKSLVYIHSQKELSPMLVGWLETILEFSFRVVHIKGILNILPDELSRLYPPRDESKLEGGKTPYRKNKKAMNKRKAYSKDKSVNILAVKLVNNKHATLDYICPPEEERDKILNETHEFGHFGSESIVQRIHADGMHWTSIYKDAVETVRSCSECQKHNISKRGYHPLTNIVAHAPFDHVTLDLAGPLPVTENGNIYLFVLTDICTRYTILRALSNKQSDTVAKTLVQIFGDYGLPKIISSDNGGEFKNSLQYDIMKTLGIDRRYTTAYHPQANGSAESAVKIALNTIRKMCKSNAQDWDHYLPIVQLAVNYKIRNRTNSSPFSLMYARTINKIKDYSSEEEIKQMPSRYMSEEELMKRIEKMEKIVFPAIKERTQRIVEEYSKRYNKRKMLIEIENGTHVMVKLPHRPNKLAPLYEGPYTVVRRTKGGSYVLKDEQNELLHRDYTPSELKVISIDESIIEDEYYTVEEIRDHRGSSGSREYLVKWAGYGDRANTWEPANNFSDPTFINQYWDKRKQLEGRANKRKIAFSEEKSINRKTRKTNYY
ncbi:hypothetical protein G6F55_009674 [Rhizopus delemar]|uniref:Reverse transcriptase n=2 Tax=Rhizopus TaxID=4842 RepID=A0A9P6YW76_9FUNG|nr:hypothetical protein G6F55_009674 [Rhizopus delemar]KAG1537100.1 hypothetical protein G6F51_010579 [Rhizopus arrhizus]KAG1545168.1 hypothetical protein G6F49_010873 [Rhizopus delemar]KAG1565126.1 hypothetical protein G6F50_010363 [Rhizopus delemar]KAG1624162.1 hypothetical protein G6F45_010284 [Rhizopus arrhizus]